MAAAKFIRCLTRIGIPSRPARTSGSARRARRSSPRRTRGSGCSRTSRGPGTDRKSRSSPKSPSPTRPSTTSKLDTRFRYPLRIHLRRGAHGRRSLRPLPEAERPRGGRCGVRSGLARGRLVVRRLDWRHRRRPAAHRRPSPTRTRKLFPRAGRFSAGRPHGRRSTCTARSTIA